MARFLLYPTVMKRFKFCAVLAVASLAIISSPLAFAEILKQAVEQAIRSTPEVLAASKHRLAADEGLKQAQGGYWPRIDVNAGIGKERLDDADARALGLRDTTLNRRYSAVTLSQMVCDGFAVKSEAARHLARIDSSAYRVAATAEDIAMRVVGVYLDVLRRQETVAAAIDNLRAHQRIYDQIKVRSDSGVGRRADLEQAEGRLALAKANLRTEQSNLKDAEVAYRRLVGMHPGMLIKPGSPAKELPASPIDETEDIPAYAGLAGTRILIVDDDVRNVYALTSALEDRGIEVLTAENGRQGVEVLQKQPGIDLVLMDIMMPDMDGYETTRAIRKIEGFRELPIIALTAKAMRGDREKSLAAGASDYITKPVEINQLMSLMRLWLDR